MSEEPFTVRNAFNGEVGSVLQAGTVNVHNGPVAVIPQEGPPVRTEWIGRERDLDESRWSCSCGSRDQ